MDVRHNEKSKAQEKLVTFVGFVTFVFFRAFVIRLLLFAWAPPVLNLIIRDDDAIPE